MANVVIAAVVLTLSLLTVLWAVRCALLTKLGRRLVPDPVPPPGVLDSPLHARTASSSNANSSSLSDSNSGAPFAAPLDDPLDAAPGFSPGGSEILASYPVKYLSEKSSHSLLRIIPWDASGTLSETDTGFRFVGSSRAGELLEIDFSSDEALINYQRGNLLWDAGVSWCVIEVNGEKHYFTSDIPFRTEHREPENDVNTTVIYRNLTNRYIQNS